MSRMILRGALRLSVVGLLFFAAGRLDWTRGQIFMGLTLATVGVNLAVILAKNPGLLRVRMQRVRPTQRFDKVFVALGVPVGLAFFIVAGLDGRFGWSDVGWSWLWVGVALHTVGMIPMSWAMATNPYLETTVRIQDERGHLAVTSGPYRLVRHPMYAGVLAMYLAWPLVLGSLYSYIPALAIVGLVVGRTAFEDRMLRRELAGYEDYSRRTRYRLLPGIW